jgi:hypothetical protein
MSGGRGVRGNRNVSPLFLSVCGGGRHVACAEAIPKEGSSFHHGSEPKANDGHDEYTSLPAAIVARTFPFTVSPRSQEFTERERKVPSVIR